MLKLDIKKFFESIDHDVLLGILWLLEKTIGSFGSDITVFLKQRLGLRLHPSKIILKTFATGVNFLGWVNFLKANSLGIGR